MCARWTRTLTLPVDRGRACGFCRRKHGKTHWMDKKSGQSLCSRCSTPLGRTQCVRLQRPTLICRGGHTAELCSKGAARASVTSRADRERDREAHCTRSAQCKMDVCQQANSGVDLTGVDLSGCMHNYIYYKAGRQTDTGLPITRASSPSLPPPTGSFGGGASGMSAIAAALLPPAVTSTLSRELQQMAPWHRAYSTPQQLLWALAPSPSASSSSACLGLWRRILTSSSC